MSDLLELMLTLFRNLLLIPDVPFTSAPALEPRTRIHLRDHP
jgi:hypothetical protein